MSERRQHRKRTNSGQIKLIKPNPYEDRVSRMIEEARAQKKIKDMVLRFQP